MRRAWMYECKIVKTWWRHTLGLLRNKKEPLFGVTDSWQRSHPISGTGMQIVRFSANWSIIFLLISSLTLQWITQSFPGLYYCPDFISAKNFLWFYFQVCASLMLTKLPCLFHHAPFFKKKKKITWFWLRDYNIFLSTSGKQSVTDVKNQGYVRTLQMLTHIRVSEICNHCTFVHGPSSET